MKNAARQLRRSEMAVAYSRSREGWATSEAPILPEGISPVVVSECHPAASSQTPMFVKSTREPEED